jgi:peroxiredoxin
MTRLFFACCVLLLLASSALAGKYNETLNIGDAAPQWTELPGTDGKKHSFADFKDKDLLVVVFTCNSCPVAADYEDRILDLAKKFAGPSGKVGLVAINVNKIAEDNLDKMKERAEAKGFTFPYLYDDSQQIAKAYGAIYTPEFFVADKNRKIIYMGGMDDSSKVDAVKNKYLVPAIEAALAGAEPATKETVARGCMIRYAKEKRTRK